MDKAADGDVLTAGVPFSQGGEELVFVGGAD